MKGLTSGDSQPAGRRRGRPLRLPEDDNPIHRVHGGVNPRVAWLLAVSRIHAADPELAHRDKFVVALHELGVAADQARVSRWESGSLRIPDRIVVAYEQVIGLAPGKLAAAINGVRRALEPLSPGNEVVLTTPATLHRELDKLFDRAFTRQHGADWLALTNYLAVHPNIYLRPETWTDLANRLIGEMARSTGPGFTRRFEATRTLVRHPGAQRHVVRAIGVFVTDPDAQSVVYPLTLLQEVPHPRAQDLVMRLLGTSSGMLQQGAAWVAATKLARGHFDLAAQRNLEGLSVLMIAAGPRATADVDIFDVAARLPDESRARVVAAVRESASFPRLENLIRTGEILPKATTREVSQRVATETQELTPPPYQIEPDLMLQRLVREALFHGHQERRHQACILLTVSPYRAGIAKSMQGLVEDAEPEVARPAAALLRYLGTEEQRADLLSWCRDEKRPDVRDHALIALGRLSEGLTPDCNAAVMDALTSCPDAEIQRASMYALGMSGAPQLADLAENGSAFQRRAATWWSRIGPAIHESSSGLAAD